ncbi:MAG: hypothetical protein ACTHLZ_13875, partial [Tepidisphaeraceae bacterium]
MSRLNAPALLSPGLPPPPAKRGWVVRYFVRNGWLHLILLTMAAIFLFPFAWMVGMSLKTDTEATSTSLFPAMPHFRGDSPWVRPAESIVRPAEVTAARWKPLEATILQKVRWLIDLSPLPVGVKAADADALRKSAAKTLTARAIERIDRNLWASDDDSIAAAVYATIGPDEPAAVLDEQLAQVKLLSLQVRSLDGRIFSTQIDRSTTRPAERLECPWDVESGDARLVHAAGADVLQYHFNSASDPPIVLQTRFKCPISIDDLHRLILSIQNDDSWHRIDASLTLEGQTWTSDLSYYIAQFRNGGLTWQPKGRLESDYAPKTWLPLSLASVDPSASGDRTATLRLTLRPSSMARAIYGKVQRNYVRAFRAVPFWLYVRNSMILVAMQLMGALFSSAFIAYAFARLNWPGRSIAFGVLLSTMMLPGQITMIPGFLIWKYLGLYNTLTPLWFGAWLGNAFFIFLMTQHM